MSKTTVKTEPVITTAVVSTTGKTEQVVSANGEVVVDAAGMAVISELMEILAALEVEEKASKETPVDEEISTFTNEEDSISSNSSAVKIMPNAAAAIAAILEALRELMILNMNNVVNNMRFTCDMATKLGKARKAATIKEAYSHLISGIMACIGAGLQATVTIGGFKLGTRKADNQIAGYKAQKNAATVTRAHVQKAKTQSQARIQENLKKAEADVAQAKAKLEDAKQNAAQDPLRQDQDPAVMQAKRELKEVTDILDAAKAAQTKNAVTPKMEKAHEAQLDVIENKGYFDTRLDNGGGRYLQGKNNSRIGVKEDLDIAEYRNVEETKTVGRLDKAAIDHLAAKGDRARLKQLEQALGDRISECNLQIKNLNQTIQSTYQQMQMWGQVASTFFGNGPAEIGRFCYLREKAEFEQAASVIEGSKELNRDGTQASQSSYNSAFEGIREAIKVLESQRQSVKVA